MADLFFYYTPFPGALQGCGGRQSKRDAALYEQRPNNTIHAEPSGSGIALPHREGGVKRANGPLAGIPKGQSPFRL